MRSLHIIYFKKRGLFDSTLICVCLISQKSIQYVTYLKILDSLAPYTKMIDGAKNIHDFVINRLLDSAIHLHLFHPVRQWKFPGRARWSSENRAVFLRGRVTVHTCTDQAEGLVPLRVPGLDWTDLGVLCLHCRPPDLCLNPVDEWTVAICLNFPNLFTV